jgi:hypothetical protein
MKMQDLTSLHPQLALAPPASPPAGGVAVSRVIDLADGQLPLSRVDGQIDGVDVTRRAGRLTKQHRDQAAHSPERVEAGEGNGRHLDLHDIADAIDHLAVVCFDDDTVARVEVSLDGRIIVIAGDPAAHLPTR